MTAPSFSLFRRRLLGAPLLLAVALAPLPAAAHAILVASTPAVNGTAAAGHARLVFRFNSRVDHAHSRLTLTGPDGKSAVLPIAPDSPADTLAAEAELPVPGAYRLHWQALAVDGHLTRGEVPFSVTTGAPAAKP